MDTLLTPWYHVIRSASGKARASQVRVTESPSLKDDAPTLLPKVTDTTGGSVR